MKKTLKLVAIFAGIVFAAVVGGLSGYVLIAKNKTYYIYDLRLVQPVADANTYIYTNNALSYTSMKNQKVYMTSEEENYIPFAVYASSSNDTKNITLKSSDPSVAKIVYKDNKAYIQYLKAGTAVITTTLADVTDSFTVEVYNQVAEDFSVYDYAYYGDYAELFPNKIIGYSDGITYAYDYKAFSAAGSNAGDLLNNDLLRIDTSKLNTDIFEDVHIDGIKKQLVVKCKPNIPTNIDEQIVVQSYTYTENGDVRVENNYVINVHIVTYIPEFLQVVLAKTPDFEDGYVFMNTSVIDASDLTDENILSNPDILDEYLAYKKAENNLVEHNEKAVYETLFTEKVSKIYLKFRKVYTNGDIVYLNPLETSKHYELEYDETYMKVAPTKDYFILNLTSEYFDSKTSFDIGLSLDVDGSEYSFDLWHDFKFTFADLNRTNIDKFYEYNEDTRVYTYKYWDPRTRYDNEVYNELGQVVGFTGI